ncbi:MAG TPA: DUF4381 domain-containing protein [Terrimicrobiaceae bacterium]
MNEDAASLDRLHDIITPPTVPWWPPAPGWYVLGAIVLLLVLVFLLRLWLRWRANAYRREALRALEAASDTAAISALLRRTALAESSHSEIAVLHGNSWVDWLAARSPEPVTPAIREQLVQGPYAPGVQSDPAALRAWAARWIASHHSAPEGS